MTYEYFHIYAPFQDMNLPNISLRQSFLIGDFHIEEKFFHVLFQF